MNDPIPTPRHPEEVAEMERTLERQAQLLHSIRFGMPVDETELDRISDEARRLLAA